MKNATPPLPTRHPTAFAPPAWADWPDLRVHCRDCRNRSGFMCVALKTSCNASELPFYCDNYSQRKPYGK